MGFVKSFFRRSADKKIRQLESELRDVEEGLEFCSATLHTVIPSATRCQYIRQRDMLKIKKRELGFKLEKLKG